MKIDRSGECGNILVLVMIRGEISIELGVSWFTTKIIKVMPFFIKKIKVKKNLLN